MKNRVFIILFFLFFQWTAIQAQSNFLYDLNMHYESLNAGPYTYLEKGDSILFEYQHKFGKYDLYTVQYTSDGGISAEPLLLKKGISADWKSAYLIDKTGCYQVRTVPDPQFRYAHGKLSISSWSPNPNVISSCLLNLEEEVLKKGYERYVSEDKILSNDLSEVELNKEVTSKGIPILTSEIKIAEGQVLLARINADPENSRINLLIKREIEGRESTLYRTFQTEDVVAIEFLSSCNITVNYWGRDIFKRASEVNLQLSR